MKTLATMVAIAIVLSVPVAAKTMLGDTRRSALDYPLSGIKSIPNLYIEDWTEGYPPDQAEQLGVTERAAHKPHGRR
jgi:hypothetical protein